MDRLGTRRTGKETDLTPNASDVEFTSASFCTLQHEGAVEFVSRARSSPWLQRNDVVPCTGCRDGAGIRMKSASSATLVCFKRNRPTETTLVSN